jgi:hypothetical protein
MISCGFWIKDFQNVYVICYLFKTKFLGTGICELITAYKTISFFFFLSACADWIVLRRFQSRLRYKMCQAISYVKETRNVGDFGLDIE